MSNYSVADVKTLREQTGAGMLDCKKALEETQGDFNKALEYLRIKGAKDVGKRAERASSEGLVMARNNTMIELNCETDFVAKNADFQNLAEKILTTAIDNNIKEIEALLAASVDETTIAELINTYSAKIGEKLELKRIAHLPGSVVIYLHKRATDLPPAVGVLLSYSGDTETATAAAKQAAMQVAALRAKYATREQVPAELLETEKRIAAETARSEGKSENIIEKIVLGKLNSFYKEVVLPEQESVVEPKKTVAQVLKAAGAEVLDFIRFEVGK